MHCASALQLSAFCSGPDALLLLKVSDMRHIAGTRGAMDVIEIPSHFMENFVHDARTLPLFAPDASQRAGAIAEQVIRDRHMFGALDLETQARGCIILLLFVCTVNSSLLQLLLSATKHHIVLTQRHSSRM